MPSPTHPDVLPKINDLSEEEKPPSSFWKQISNNTSSYLSQTTVHGFRYLTEGQTRGEKLFWTSFISTGFICAWLLMQQSYDESISKPILTTIDSKSVDLVPFPAVTIDSGDVINPWGYLERAGSLLQIDECDEETSCYESNSIHRDWHEIKVAFMNLIQNGLKQRVDEMDLTQKQTLFGDIGKYMDRLNISFTGSEFDYYVGILAETIETNDSYVAHLETMLNTEIYEPVAKTIFPGMHRKDNFVKAKQLSIAVNVLQETFFDASVIKNSSYNPASFDKAYGIIMKHLLFINHAVPNFLDYTYFGYMLSYVTEKNTYRTDGNSPKLNDLFTKITNNISPRKLNISAFELVNLVDTRGGLKYWFEYIAPYAQMKCDIYTYYLSWKACNIGPNYNASGSDTVAVSGCCDLRHGFEQELEPILKLMKYSEQPTTHTMSKKEYDFDFANISDILGYPSMEFDDTAEMLVSRNPRVFTCQYITEGQKNTPSFCNMFSRSITNDGFGYSFNQGDFWTYHQPTIFNKMFQKVMFPFESSDGTDGIRFSEGSGTANGLHMTLLLNSYKKSYESRHHMKLGSSFRVAIHAPGVPPDMRAGHVQVFAGFESSFLIDPTQIISSSNVQALDPDLRDCRFRDERDSMMIFKDYTQQGCRFECQLMQAVKECGCIPWNYPQLENTTRTCDYRGAPCFADVMNNNTMLRTCKCPTDCETVTYTYSVSHKLLDFNPDYCNVRLMPRPFMFSYTNGVERSMDSYDDRTLAWKEVYCAEQWQDIATVTVQLISPIILQMKKDVRVTFADTLSTFGGTIGLFTGMSLLSLIEILFWTLRLFTGTGMKNVKRQHRQRKSLTNEVMITELSKD